MRFPNTGTSPAFIALALASLTVAACRSAPTAPSASDVSSTPPTGTAVESPPSSLSTGTTQAVGTNAIKITQGTLAFRTNVPGPVTLQGSRGFKFDGSVISGLDPAFSCATSNPCQPGATVPVTPSWVGTDIPGTVRLQGVEYAVGSANTGSIYIELAATFVAPAHVTDTATVTVPFTTTGLLSLDYPLPQIPFSGRGQVTFTLQWQPFIGGWGIVHTAYDFGRGRAV